MDNQPQNTRSWRNWFKYFQYEEDWDPPTEVRNVLLVVATLIAAVIFQAAGVKPISLLAGFRKVMTMEIEEGEPFMHLKNKPFMFS